jgi:hypothetical protein
VAGDQRRVVLSAIFGSCSQLERGLVMTRLQEQNHKICETEIHEQAYFVVIDLIDLVTIKQSGLPAPGDEIEIQSTLRIMVRTQSSRAGTVWRRHSNRGTRKRRKRAHVDLETYRYYLVLI